MITRNVMYMYYIPKEKCLYTFNIMFKEFVDVIKSINVLLLKSESTSGEHHLKSGFDFVRSEELNELTEENVYTFGDFCWVDFDNVDSLDNMSPNDIAELLYLGHMMIPLKSAEFTNLKNRFAYLAHDDGWYNKLYINNEEDLLNIISKIIPYKVDILDDLNQEIVNELFDKVQKGLLINFDNKIVTEGKLEIPFYTVGRFDDMDKCYHTLSEIIMKNERSKGWLVYDNEWEINPY